MRSLVYNSSLANLFWPWARNSLAPEHDIYAGHFALQVGLVPTAGALLTLFILIANPNRARGARLMLPLTLFGFYTALTIGYANLWTLMPMPLRGVLYTYRMIGFVNLAGFILPLRALPALDRAGRPPAARLILATGLGGLAIVAVLAHSTYWYRQPAGLVRSASIRASALTDFSQMFSPTKPVKDRFLRRNAWLATPLVTLPAGQQVEVAEIPSERTRRGAFGRLVIDARGLAPGYYRLPAFDYDFVRILDQVGHTVPRYRLDGRPVIRHTEADRRYKVSYALEPEVAAIILGFLLVVTTLPLTADGVLPGSLDRRGHEF